MEKKLVIHIASSSSKVSYNNALQPIHRRYAASFRFIGDSWAIDNSSAYHALTWVSLGCENNGFLKVRVFNDIDQETFEVIDSFKAKDKGAVYDALPSRNNRVN